MVILLAAACAWVALVVASVRVVGMDEPDAELLHEGGVCRHGDHWIAL